MMAFSTIRVFCPKNLVISGTNADLLVAESKSGKEDGLYAFSPNLTRPVTLERERERAHNKVLFWQTLVENGVTAKEPK